MLEYLNVCPCGFFIVILNHNLTGNCSLLNWNDNSVDMSEILGKNTVVPLSFSDIPFASMILFDNGFIVILLPLHNFGESKFPKKVIGDTIFNFKHFKAFLSLAWNSKIRWKNKHFYLHKPSNRLIYTFFFSPRIWFWIFLINIINYIISYY